jgi:hypothetical protein
MKIISDKGEWNSLLESSFPDYNDTYLRYEYFEIYKKHFHLKPEAVFWDDGKVSIFFPHLVRSIGKINIFSGMEYFDLTTPYGYSGPVINTGGSNEAEIRNSLVTFRKDYFAYAKESKYISEFIRFHPVFESWSYFQQVFEIRHLNDTIIVDLTKSIEDLQGQLSKNTRRYLKKSYKEFNQIKIIRHPSEGEFEVFHSLYEDTMKQQNASEKYFFDTRFIEDHFRLLDSLFIYCQNKNGEIGSIGLFFKGKNILHYHLGATNYNSSSSPLRAVIWEAILWGKQNGCTHLHLGGGLSHNDSLFAFKRGFSELTLSFNIGKIIFDDTTYHQLVHLNPSALADEQFFPQYRAGTNTNIVE